MQILCVYCILWEKKKGGAYYTIKFEANWNKNLTPLGLLTKNPCTVMILKK